MRREIKRNQAAFFLYHFTLFVTIFFMLLLPGCITPIEKGAPQTVTLAEAKKITVTLEGQTFASPPRTINDITSILAQENLTT